MYYLVSAKTDLVRRACFYINKEDCTVTRYLRLIEFSGRVSSLFKTVLLPGTKDSGMVFRLIKHILLPAIYKTDCV